MYLYLLFIQEKLEDTKGIIRSHNSKNNNECNDHQKRDKATEGLAVPSPVVTKQMERLAKPRHINSMFIVNTPILYIVLLN